MNQKRNSLTVYFRVDASTKIGIGHIMRCMAIAEALLDNGAHVNFICKSLDKKFIEQLTEKEIILHIINDLLDERNDSEIDQNFDAAETIKILNKEKNKIDWMVIDHYSLGVEWEQKIRKFVEMILVIDDLADRVHDCDILLDQNLYEDMHQRYDGIIPYHCRKLLGPRYALLRNEFINAPIKEKDGKRITNILISFGGSDPKKDTIKALEAIAEINGDDIKVDIVISDLIKHKNTIEKICVELDTVELHKNVRNMSELMGRNDIAIGAGGITTWERCYLQLPSIVIANADNQVEASKMLARDGAIIYLGISEKVNKQNIKDSLKFFINNSYFRDAISNRAKKLVDGKGIKRVVKYLFANEEIRLRSATLDDCDAVYRWRNSEIVRKFSFNNSEIEFNQHKQWYKNVLRNDCVKLFIGESAKEPIGVVRYDYKNKNDVIISIYIRPDKHGMGYGQRLINVGTEWIEKNQTQVNRIIAEIIPGNDVSIRIFENAGYTLHKREYIRMIEKNDEPSQ